MKSYILIAVAVIAFSLFGKAASTTWESKPHTHKHGIYFRCPHCGQTWGNTPPNLKAWETRHISMERSKYIKSHMRIVHGKRI